MGFFDATRAQYLAGGTVRASLLAYFDFVGQPMRYWLGAGPLRTLDSLAWEGTGGLGKISGLDSAIGTTAPNASFALPGVDARAAALARAQSDLVKGQDVELYLQFFGDDLTLLDLPYQFWTGEMDLMTYAADGQGSFTITVSAEGVWTGRSRPPFGFWTDTDQESRFPGDRGLEQVSSLTGKTIYWPTF